MTMTFQEIINHEHFKMLNVLTDPSFNDNVYVTNVEITETPDYEAFAQNGGLVLTTAMYFKDRQEELIPFIDSLIRVDIKVLGIKTGRFLGELDPKIIDYANQKQFIIFNIPIEVSLGSLLHQMLNLVWGTQNEEVLFAIEAQKRFSELLINDAPSDIMINELSLLVKSPIILLNPYREIISQSKKFDYPTKFYVDQIFDKQSLIDHTSTIIIDGYHGPIEAFIIPIEVYRYFPHYLIVLNSDKIPYPISTFTLELAALVLKFTFYKNQKVSESRWQIEANEFKDYINIDNPTVFPQQLKNAGYIHFEYYQMIHISEATSINSAYTTAYIKEQIALTSEWLHQNIDNYFNSSVIIHFIENQQIYLLLQEECPDLDLTLSQMAEDIRSVLPIDLIFSISLIQNSWKELSEAYIQANYTFQERIANHDTERIRYYQNKGALHLFSHMSETDTHYFCQSTLKDLYGPHEDDSNYAELKNTLKVYLDCQCEITRTANTLFIHRNTVKYRIQRIEEILECDISSPENSLNLRIALMLDE